MNEVGTYLIHDRCLVSMVKSIYMFDRHAKEFNF